MQSSALIRKLDRADLATRNAARPIPRALRLALARVAAASIDLHLSVIGINELNCVEDELPDQFGEDRLFFLLVRADEAQGAITVDRCCVTALMQQQTIGKVEGDQLDDRAFTGTDAAMTIPLCDQWLVAADELLSEAGEMTVFNGFSVLRAVQTQRELALVTPPGEYCVFQITVDIANGICQGQLTLIIPRPTDQLSEQPGDAEREKPTLGESSGVIRANLKAVLFRTRLPLQTFTALSPDDILPLDGCRLEKTELTSIDGKCVAHARLGQSRGMRAVRLNEPEPQAEMLSEPAPFLEHTVPKPQAPNASVLSPETGDMVVEREIIAGNEPRAKSATRLPDQPNQVEAEISELAGLEQATGKP